jgi:sortase A
MTDWATSMSYDRRTFLSLAAGTSAVGLITACQPNLGLPVPSAPPANPRAKEPDVKLGRIAIARLALDVDLREGITLTTLDKGPGHWPGTAMPGAVGNCVVAGHRVTHSKPFRHINTMKAGDQVTFTLLDGTAHVYNFRSSEVVPDTGVHIVDQTNEKTATLFACHPPGSARYRYVVHLILA